MVLLASRKYPKNLFAFSLWFFIDFAEGARSPDFGLPFIMYYIEHNKTQVKRYVYVSMYISRQSVTPITSGTRVSVRGEEESTVLTPIKRITFSLTWLL